MVSVQIRVSPLLKRKTPHSSGWVERKPEELGGTGSIPVEGTINYAKRKRNS